MEAVPEKNEEFGVPKKPDIELSSDQTAEPEISKLDLNHIPTEPEPCAEEPTEESVSNIKLQEQGDEKNIGEIKPEVPSTSLNILEPQEEMKNMGNNVTVFQNMDTAVKDDLTPKNSTKQVEGPVTVPKEKPTPPTSPLREEDKGEAEYEKSPPETKSPAKPRFQKKVSGSGSGADNNNIDLNLSISTFISKSKEAGSVSVQVSN